MWKHLENPFPLGTCQLEAPTGLVAVRFGGSSPDVSRPNRLREGGASRRQVGYACPLYVRRGVVTEGSEDGSSRHGSADRPGEVGKGGGSFGWAGPFWDPPKWLEMSWVSFKTAKRKGARRARSRSPKCLRAGGVVESSDCSSRLTHNAKGGASEGVEL